MPFTFAAARQSIAAVAAALVVATIAISAAIAVMPIA